jgi:hypothetical protein
MASLFAGFGGFRRVSAAVKVAAVLVMMAAFVPSANAIVAFNATGSNPNGGNFAGLRLGNDFSVSGNGVTVTHLGVYDSFANGLVTPHTVRLFSLSADNVGIELGSVVVPAGTAGTLDGVGSGHGFRYLELAAPIFLPAGTRGSVVAYNLFGVAGTNDDPYGDGAGDPTGNVAWFGHNRYIFDTASTGLPPYQGGDGNRHAAASFQYFNGAMPEPTTASLALIGIGGLFMRRRRAA